MRLYLSLLWTSLYSCLRRPPRWLSLVVLSLLLTFLNAIKPLHIDDVGFHRYAAQIAAEPLSPYGFEIIWEHVPRPAIEILAPPVLPYWWGLGIHLLGQQPFLWKLWLLPFSLLLVFSLHALLRRFVRMHGTALLWMTVLSPAFLPGYNLMTDIPALALSLFAVAVFLRAAERGSASLALMAGLLAGLAMQTKYTAFITPAVLLLYATLFRRIRLGLLASSVAALVFLVWECLVVARHGASHFLCSYTFFHAMNSSPWARTARLMLALPTLTGGLAPAVILLGMAALRQSRLAILLTGAAIFLGYVLLLTIPEPWTTLFRYPRTAKPLFTVNDLVYGALGTGICIWTTAAARRLLRAADREQAPQVEPKLKPPYRSGNWLALLPPSQRTAWFLVLWLGLEVAGYLVLSPFPAARRVLGVLVVSTLLVGRLAGRTCRTPPRVALPRWLAAGAALLGLAFYGVDWRDASAQKRAAEGAAQVAHNCHSGGAVWVVAIWGFEFYAERAGLQPLVLGRSLVRKGDRLVVYDDYFFWQPAFPYREAPLQFVDRLQVEDALPLRTVVCYYYGATSLRHQQGPRASATVYQATADFVPRGTSSAGNMTVNTQSPQRLQ